MSILDRIILTLYTCIMAVVAGLGGGGRGNRVPPGPFWWWSASTGFPWRT